MTSFAPSLCTAHGQSRGEVEVRPCKKGSGGCPKEQPPLAQKVVDIRFYFVAFQRLVAKWRHLLETNRNALRVFFHVPTLFAGRPGRAGSPWTRSPSAPLSRIEGANHEASIPVFVPE